jgi:hypothetical protein
VGTRGITKKNNVKVRLNPIKIAAESQIQLLLSKIKQRELEII